MHFNNVPWEHLPWEHLESFDTIDDAPDKCTNCLVL